MTKNHIIKLAETYGAKLNLSHWAVSMRILKKGDFFLRLNNGRDCQTGTANKVLVWFSTNWPTDLDWPSDIPRPEKAEDAA